MPQYHPAEVHTHFAYPVEGSLADAAMRCVGVGKCRKTDGGAMCPSYMATGDEQHTTRGRARLLFEMLQGEVVTDGFRSEAVKEALDLCLSCKSCKSECPTGVDMAAYKAEFLAHYYEGRRRPLRSYAFGLINHWGAMAEYVPWLANFFMQVPPFSSLDQVGARRRAGAAVAGVRARAASGAGSSQARSQKPEARSRQRLAPSRLAPSPESRVPSPESRRVLLWPDCSNNYFHPEVAHAAVAVLEAAGFTVDIPRERLCCGRPLYDHGMLTAAQAAARRDPREPARRDRGRHADRRARAELRLGVPRRVAALLPRRPAGAEAQPAGAVPDRVPREAPAPCPRSRLQGRAIVHPHCHERASLCLDDDMAVLKATGLDFTVLDAGCCGMAGAFGFERDHFEVSRAVGERVLLPAVRAAAPETYIVTNGFSCREQITQITGRRVWHMAELLAQAKSTGATPGERSR